MILKTAKQERTINPDTRLHSDEMRKKDEKKRRLARNPREGNITGGTGRVTSGELVHRSMLSDCNLRLERVVNVLKRSPT